MNLLPTTNAPTQRLFRSAEVNNSLRLYAGCAAVLLLAQLTLDAGGAGLWLLVALTLLSMAVAVTSARLPLIEIQPDRLIVTSGPFFLTHLAYFTDVERMEDRAKTLRLHLRGGTKSWHVDLPLGLLEDRDRELVEDVLADRC